MGATDFEEADLLYCCSTSQAVKERKTSPPTLQDTGAAFASFPDHVPDILWCLLTCILLPFLKRSRRPGKYQHGGSPTSSWNTLSRWRAEQARKIVAIEVSPWLICQAQGWYSVTPCKPQLIPQDTPLLWILGSVLYWMAAEQRTRLWGGSHFSAFANKQASTLLMFVSPALTSSHLPELTNFPALGLLWQDLTAAVLWIPLQSYTCLLVLFVFNKCIHIIKKSRVAWLSSQAKNLIPRTGELNSILGLGKGFIHHLQQLRAKLENKKLYGKKGISILSYCQITFLWIKLEMQLPWITSTCKGGT